MAQLSLALDRIIVKNVSYENAGNEDRIVIELSSPVEPKTFLLSDPQRTVIDFADAVWPGTMKEIRDAGKRASFVRWAQTSHSPDIFRIVVGQINESALEIKKDDEGKKITIILSDSGKSPEVLQSDKAYSPESISVSKKKARQETMIDIPDFVSKEKENARDEIIEGGQNKISISSKIKFPKLPAFKKFSVKINAKKLNIGRRPVFIGNTLMAEAKEVFDLCGYDYSFDKKTATATAVLSNEVKARIKTNSKYMTINGQKSALEQPAKKISGKLFVPLNSVIKWLGMAVYWDKKEKTLYIGDRITDILWDQSEENIKIISTRAAATYDAELKEEPMVLAFNIPGFILDVKETKIPIKEEEIRGIKAFQAKGDVKIGVYLESKQYSMVNKKDKELVISFPTAIEFVGITDEAEYTRVDIATSKASAFEPKYLTEPDRLIIDVPGALFKASPRIERGKTGVLRLRASQFSTEPLISRIVIDLSETTNYQTAVTDDNKVFSIYFEKSKPAKAKPAKKAKKIKILKDKIIIVDPGHGGSDPGAFGVSGEYVKEKNLNLSVANKLAGLLSEAGAIPLMTRDDDSELSLQKRVEFAANNKADIYVSTHFNASEDKPDTKGTEVYYFNPNSKLLADIIYNNLTVNIARPLRGVSKVKFYVVSNTTMPSALVEPVYLTNKEEEALAIDPAFQDKVARGIFEGIKQYFEVLSNL